MSNKRILIPHAGIVLVMGPSCSGKTTLIKQLIEQGVIIPSEVVSSDQFRTLISDIEFLDWTNRSKEEADCLMSEYQRISQEAFTGMDMIIEKRSRLNKLTLVDATHLHADDRQRYIQIARRQHVPIMAIALDVPESELLRRDIQRDYPRGKKRIKQQVQVFRRNQKWLKKEGFQSLYILSQEEINTALFERRRNNPLHLDIGQGLDIIGDIHGCYEEMLQLLSELGYEENEDGFYIHPEGRKFLSLGDVMSRGPRSLDTLRFFLRHVTAGYAYMIDSNHGWKIARWLDGRKVRLTHGDEKVEHEFESFSENKGKEAAEQLKQQLKDLLWSAPSHYVIRQNDVTIAVATHAGIKDHYIGKHSSRISDFCRYGDTDGVDELGKPIRKDWHLQHKSKELIIWGHDPKPQPWMVNQTINIDQGVVFGGKLTAFRLPERKLFSISAKEDYAQDTNSPLRLWEKKRFAPPNMAKFIHGYSVWIEGYGEVSISSSVAKSALDEFSHYTVPLEELVYLPPTMSPTLETSKFPDYLEHPLEAFQYYRDHGVTKMIAQKKHMGSRGILLLFRNRNHAKAYIGKESLGSIYTRTGRRFFQPEIEKKVIEQLHMDLTNAGYFEKYETDFVLLDAEILPWNVKAKELIRRQYAHVGEMADLGRQKLKEFLQRAKENGRVVEDWMKEVDQQLSQTKTFNEVYPAYCWETDGIEGIQIAPFHTLAHSKGAFFDHTHEWHMEHNRELSQISLLFIETEYRVITDETSMQEAIKWWEAITEDGHEGFVVKPEFFLTRDDKGKIIQPAIKVRGRKYLHIIYGMDYIQPENLQRLKQRNVGRKQRNALREFALGIEGIQRFVNRESLDRIHECVLGVLALEAQPVDPRL